MNISEYITGQLNEEQAKSALYTDTSSLIIAGAGSGKTRVLTYKIAYLLWGKKLSTQDILAVTFTNKAAAEMKERLVTISKDLSSKNISSSAHDSSDDLDGFLQAMESSGSVAPITHFPWIGTFHSIFLKILKEDIVSLGMKYTSNFGIVDSSESQSLMKDVLKKLGMDEALKVQEVKGVVSAQKNLGLDPREYGTKASSSYDMNMYKIYQAYQKALEDANVVDFDDLLLLPYLLFKHHPEVLKKWQHKFRYILVDEAQDTNRIQFELMKMLSAEHKNITLIGDDFQSIYGRRGAVMENFLNVKKYWPDIVMFKLQTNYRSRPHIIHAGNQVIKNNLNQYQKEIVAHRTGDDKIICFSHPSEVDEAANVIEFFKKMKESGKISSWGQVAILYRTNAQSSPFEQILLQEGIPYKIRGAFKFFERKEIKDILSYVKFFINIQDSISLKRVLNVPERGIGKTTLQHLEEFAQQNNYSLYHLISHLDQLSCKVTPKALQGIKKFVDVISSLQHQIHELTPSDFLSLLVKKIEYKAYLVKEEGNENIADEKYENIGQLINMAEKYVEKGENALRQMMEEVALLTDINENETGDIDAVKLMTVHASKGLEFPLVFVVGLEDSVFPLANSMLEPKLIEEERRLMYVAITRAKDHLFLSYASSRMTWGQTKNNAPSRFVSEISSELIKKYELGGSGFEKENVVHIEAGDTVKHKMFGTGYVIEVWNKLAIVKFHNPKFGVRKIEMRFLTVV